MTALGPSENCHYIRLFLQPIILTVGAGLGACVRIILTTNAPASMFASHSSRLTRVGRRGRRRGRRKSQSRANCGWISIIVSYSGRLYWILSFGCQPRPVARRRARRPWSSWATGTGRKLLFKKIFIWMIELLFPPGHESNFNLFVTLSPKG